ncbi:MAG: hypothetical protein K1X29_04495 [Bdellovibrionales bacterium]|nr:hypothetical protein [Bdellovibrionales bacterium]
MITGENHHETAVLWSLIHNILKYLYRAKYNELVFKLGSKNKAKVAIANRLTSSIWK